MKLKLSSDLEWRFSRVHELCSSYVLFLFRFSLTIPLCYDCLSWQLWAHCCFPRFLMFLIKNVASLITQFLSHCNIMYSKKKKSVYIIAILSYVCYIYIYIHIYIYRQRCRHERVPYIWLCEYAMYLWLFRLETFKDKW